MKTRKWTSLVGVMIGVTLLASTMYAQQGQFNSEIGNGQWSAVEPPVSPAYTDHGYFNAEIGNVPQSEAWSSDSGEENFVVLSRIVENDLVPEGQSVYERLMIRRELHTQTAGLAVLTEPIGR